MKKILTQTALVMLTALACHTAQAGGHYVPGVEGIQAASVPPPGDYYLGYMVHYNIDQLRAPGSSDAIPMDNKGTVNALANRYVKITNTQILGANYGYEVIVPIISKSLTFKAAGVSETNSGIGDVYLGPLVLGWHGANWDAVAAAGFWLDNASSDTLSSAGNGYKSTMLTAGATYYFDTAKSWSGSALMRYEVNGTDKFGNTPGSQVSIEWGIGKAIGPVQVGVVGYDQMQVSNDTGGSNSYERHAIGAEVVYPLMSVGVILKAAYYNEYSAKGGSGPQAQGSALRFTLVKAF